MNAKNLIGYLLCLLAGAAIGYFLMKPATKSPASLTQDADQVEDLPPFVMKVSGTIGQNKADSMVRFYRGYSAHIKSTDLIWHNQDSLKHFIDSVFIKYTAKVAPPAGYEWRLAITPMLFNEKGQARLTVCLLPCLVDKTDPVKGYDFFAEKQKNSAIYKDYFLKLYDSVKTESYAAASGGPRDTTIIFDEGQLWP